MLRNLKNWLYLSNVGGEEPIQKTPSFIGRQDALKQILSESANDRSSGYGHHSGYGDPHSGYGGHHSGYGGYGYPDGYASHSGYGHEPCCPPVIDPLTLAAFLGIFSSLKLELRLRL